MFKNKFNIRRDKACLVSAWIIQKLFNHAIFKEPTFIKNKNGVFELNRNHSSALNSIHFQQYAVIIKIRPKMK